MRAETQRLAADLVDRGVDPNKMPIRDGALARQRAAGVSLQVVDEGNDPRRAVRQRKVGVRVIKASSEVDTSDGAAVTGRRMDENGGAARRIANLDCGTRMIAVGREANRGAGLCVLAAQLAVAGRDAAGARLPDPAIV